MNQSAASTVLRQSDATPNIAASSHGMDSMRRASARCLIRVGGLMVVPALLGLTGCGRKDTSGDSLSSASLEQREEGPSSAQGGNPLPDVSALQDALDRPPVTPQELAIASPASDPNANDQIANDQIANDLGDSKPLRSRQQEPTATQLREQALKAFGQGDEDLAFELVRKARRLDPEDPEVTFFYAMVLADRHRFEEACKILDQLGEREPKTRLPSLGQTAQWMVESAHYDEAESRYRVILEEAPDAPILHHQLGMLLFQLGKRTEAAEHFRFLSRLGELNQEELRTLLTISQPFPQDEESGRMLPLNELARARQRFASDDAAAALEIIEAVAGDSSAAASLKTRILAEQGTWGELETLLSDNKIGPFDADGWYASGLLAAHQKNDEQAIDDFCRALLVDPTDPNVYESLSQSLTRTGKTEEAKEAATRAQTLQQVRELGAALTRGDLSDRSRIAQLVPLLLQLNRPLEAVGWQGIDLIYAADAGLVNEQAAEQAFLSLTQHRRQLLSSGQFQIPLQFILCGLEPPAPAFAEEGSDMNP